MSCPQIVASIGLVLDIIGALLIAKDYWRSPIVSKYEKGGEMFDTSAQARRVQEQIKNYPYAKCGLVLIIVGFMMQLVAQWI